MRTGNWVKKFQNITEQTFARTSTIAQHFCCQATKRKRTEKTQSNFVNRTLSKKTQNQILTYNNEPILAAFHAISSGRTEKSSDVWSEQLPYLINVDSELDKNVNGYLSTVSLKQTELKNYFSDNADTNISIISRTDGGNVKEINIFGNIYTGQDVRNKLNLRSANFSVKKNKDEYIFEVYGYGHGVGMSQCGANEYAKKGMDYQKILLKYFPNTVLSTIN